MPPLVRDQSTAVSVLMLKQEEMYRDCREKIKCVLVGDGAVGKTSLVVSYTTNGYPTEYVPTAFDNYNVMVNVDNQPLRLQLCDTAGQDDFDSLRPLCYPSTDVFLLCFSVVSPTSFYNVTDKWIPELKKHCAEAPIILVGTQSDLRTDVKVLIELANYREQPITDSDARRLAYQIGAECYIESSALTQKNLKEVFDQAILCSLNKKQEFQKSSGKSKGRKVTGKNSEKKISNKKDKKYSRSAHEAYSEHKKKSLWKRFCCMS